MANWTWLTWPGDDAIDWIPAGPNWFERQELLASLRGGPSTLDVVWGNPPQESTESMSDDE